MNELREVTGSVDGVHSIYLDFRNYPQACKCAECTEFVSVWS